MSEDAERGREGGNMLGGLRGDLNREVGEGGSVGLANKDAVVIMGWSEHPR